MRQKKNSLLTAIELFISGSQQVQIKPNMRLSNVREKTLMEGIIQRYNFTPEGYSDSKWIMVLSGEASKEYL